MKPTDILKFLKPKSKTVVRASTKEQQREWRKRDQLHQQLADELGLEWKGAK